VPQKNDTHSFSFYFVQPPAFPPLHFVGIIGILYAVVQAILGNYTQAGILMLLSALIILLRSWTRLNIKNQTLTDFFLIVPYRNLKIKNLAGIRITSDVVNQTLNSRGSTSTISYICYKLLLVTDTETIVLKESRNKARMLKKAGQIALAAGVTLDDRTADN
jgi:hypothetical protein